MTPTFGENYDGNEPTRVRFDDSVDLNWTNDEWEDLLFDTPFTYNGVDNVIIEWRWQGDEGEDVYVRGWYPPGGNRVLDGSTVNGTTGILRDYMNRLRIFYSTIELAGGLDGGELVITWSPVPMADEYWVFGAANLPYFEPGPAPDFEYRLAILPTETTIWSSSLGIADAENNWAYLVIAVDDTGQELLESNRLGEFDLDMIIPR